MRCLNLTKEHNSLNGKIVVVTGGAGLIGKAICLGLAEAGAKTYIADINKKEGIKLEKQSDKLEWIYLDITDEESVKNGIKTIVETDCKIDVWINSAYPRTADWSDKFEDIKFESWKKNIDMHLNGYFLCCQKIAMQMKKQKSGSIINFSSIYGIVGPNFSIYEETSSTMPAAYSAIKGGIISFTKYLATYFAEYGIRANVICPGGILDNQNKNFIKNYEEKTPMKRMGKPEDIVGSVVFLASDASSYMTGVTIIVDGGWTTW
jgi:NAD(P)-dependent dehydrogenase (short-subunit alcohol dehydrogenase family)